MSEEGTSVQSRKWIATLWLHQVHVCLEETMKNLTDTGRVRFIAYGEEVCPETGSLHYQTYVVCYKPTRMSQLIKWFGEGHHFEPMYGSLRQNEVYCSKEGSFHKLGDEPKQGERHDLIGFKRKLDEGLQPAEIAEDEGHFGSYVKYHNGFEKYSHHLQWKKRVAEGYKKPEVFILTGVTGSCKSKYPSDQHGECNVWRTPIGNNNGKWFDGYNGQCAAVFDDVHRGAVPSITDFLRLTDGYPVKVPVKGGFVVWKPSSIYFTSNEVWEYWWPDLNTEHRNAVMRRITRVMVFKADGSIE